MTPLTLCTLGKNRKLPQVSDSKIISKLIVDSSRIGELPLKATFYVYVLRLRSTLLKQPNRSLATHCRDGATIVLGRSRNPQFVKSTCVGDPSVLHRVHIGCTIFCLCRSGCCVSEKSRRHPRHSHIDLHRKQQSLHPVSPNLELFIPSHISHIR